MGGTSYSDATYTARATSRAATGRSAFDYTDSGTGAKLGTHPTLDPIKSSKLDGKGAVREARDNDLHPASVPIAIWFDCTGSMGSVPRKLQEKMPQLLGLLLRKGYVADPQILFAAIGDATCDHAPVQVGQFEYDNTMEDHLGNLYLEGGGGAQKTESYELALYFMARRVVTDAWEKRGHRGYLFIIGDEMAYPGVKRREVSQFIGNGDDNLQADVPLADILAEAQEKWDVYYVMPGGTQYDRDTEVPAFWRNLLGQQFLRVDDLAAIPETIALTVGLAEGTVDSLDAGLDDLADVGSGDSARAVGRALAMVGAAAGGAVATTPPPGDLDTPSGNDRL